MKRVVRNNVFETNSSSTHSLTICTQSDYTKWENGELYQVKYAWEDLEPLKEMDLVSKEQLIEKIECLTEDNFDELVKQFISEGDLQTFDSVENYHLESYSTKFTTPSGDKMVAFGEYGYDG